MTHLAPRQPEAASTERPLAVAFLRASADTAIVADGLKRLADIRWCLTVEEARACLDEAPSTLLLITERAGEADHETDGLIRDVRHTSPFVHVIVIAASRTDAKRDAKALRDFHVTHLSRDTPEALHRRASEIVGLERLRERRASAAARCARSAPDETREAVRHAVQHGHRQMSVRQLADALGVPRKTLDRRFARTCAMTVRQLLGWGRLIAAAMQLEAHGATVGSAARDLRFPSASSLRNLLQRYCRLTPTELMASGGAEYLVERLRESLAAPTETLGSP